MRILGMHLRFLAAALPFALAATAAAQPASGINGSGHFVKATALFNDFGPGTDGDITCTTSTSLSRVAFYNNLTLASGCTLQPTTYAIYVAGTLTIQSGGKISANGAAGASSTGASTCSVTGAHTYGSGYTGGYVATFQSPGQPSATAGLGSLVMIGGNGGGGGTGGSGAGAAGGGTSFAYKSGSPNVAAFSMDFLMRGAALTPGGGTSALSYPTGGGGGGVGGAGSGGNGASGGCGGDVIGVFARKVVIQAGGRIESLGGAGAAATNANAAGGGGGGGGALLLRTNDYTNLGAVDLSGGAGGAGNGTGTAGAAGAAGTFYLFTPGTP